MSSLDHLDNLEMSRDTWRDLFYDVAGMIRNEIRTGKSEKARLDTIEKYLNDKLVEARGVK